MPTSSAKKLAMPTVSSSPALSYVTRPPSVDGMPQSVAPIRTVPSSTQSSASPLPPTELPLPPPPTPPEVLAPWLFFTPKTPTLPPQATASAMLPQVTPTATTPSPVVPSVPDAAAPKPLPQAANTTLNQPRDKKEEDKPPSAPNVANVPVHGFDDITITNINARLEDPDYQKRADAAEDFFLTLNANPRIETNPTYKPYVDAFMLKILRDPRSVVHQPAFMAIQTGLYTQPTDDVLKELEILKDSTGLMGLEPQMVDDALQALAERQNKQAKELLSLHTNTLSPEQIAGQDWPVNPTETLKGDDGNLPEVALPDGLNPLPTVSTLPMAADQPLGQGVLRGSPPTEATGLGQKMRHWLHPKQQNNPATA